MAAPLGHPRYGGRSVGSQNRRSKELVEILKQHGYCPVAEFIETGFIAKKEYDRISEIYDAIQEKRASMKMVPLMEEAHKYLKVRQDSAAGVMPYAFPKMSSVELTGKDGQDLFQNFTNAMRQVAGIHAGHAGTDPGLESSSDEPRSFLREDFGSADAGALPAPDPAIDRRE